MSRPLHSYRAVPACRSLKLVLPICSAVTRAVLYNHFPGAIASVELDNVHKNVGRIPVPNSRGGRPLHSEPTAFRLLCEEVDMR